MDKSLLERLTAWRRHLHQNPELSLQEQETSAFVQAKLTELGVPFVAGVGGHGIVASLTRGSSGNGVGLRGDMDALPIQEETGLPHASTRAGVMHACGHDGHTVALLGAAALLQQDQSWSGTVHFIFQPAEEGYGGAVSMIGDGLFERFPMQRIFGFHNWPGVAAGTVVVHDGAVMASGSRLIFTIDGHAGHAGLPHLTRDPMLAAAHLIVALQTIVSRNIDPLDSAVLSLGSIEGGVATNQIPSRIVIKGTTRMHRTQVRRTIETRIREICAGIAAAMNVTITAEITPGAQPLINSPAEAGIAAAAAESAGLALRRDMPPSMAGEDFTFFLDHKPGAFVWIGNGDIVPGGELHGPKYDFNDAILPAASGWMASVAKRALMAN